MHRLRDGQCVHTIGRIDDEVLERVEVLDAVPPEDVLSINTTDQLAEVDRIYRSRRANSQHTEGAAS